MGLDFAGFVFSISQKLSAAFGQSPSVLLITLLYSQAPDSVCSVGRDAFTIMKSSIIDYCLCFS
jgi:hypothetical protein